MAIKIKQKNVHPTEEQIKMYKQNIGIFYSRTSNIRFGKLVILSDQDLDGFHISALLISFLAKFWPELFDLGMVYGMSTPLYIAKTKNGEHEFFTEEEYTTWAKNAPKHTADYFKGLGGFDTKTFAKLLENREKYLTKISKLEALDFAKLELAFSDADANARKAWLSEVNYFGEFE